MVGLGRRLGIDVVAQGLEAPAHLDVVRGAGCRLGQGHLFARPQPAEHVEAYLDGFRCPLRSRVVTARWEEEGAMRFDVTHVLDAIERHLTTEAALAQAVVDLGQVAWFDALDGGRPVNLLRTGLLVDALARHLGEDAVMIYPVAGPGPAHRRRPDLQGADGARPLGRRRAHRGRAGRRRPGGRGGRPHRLAGGDPRRLSRALEPRYPWLRGQPDRVLRLVPGRRRRRAFVGGQPGPRQAGRSRGRLLGRVWRCPRRDCPTFGERRGGPRPCRACAPACRSCPRHDEPLVNAGPRAARGRPWPLIVDGVVRDPVRGAAGRPVTVGRSPDDPDGLSDRRRTWPARRRR